MFCLSTTCPADGILPDGENLKLNHLENENDRVNNKFCSNYLEYDYGELIKNETWRKFQESIDETEENHQEQLILESEKAKLIQNIHLFDKKIKNKIEEISQISEELLLKDRQILNARNEIQNIECRVSEISTEKENNKNYLAEFQKKLYETQILTHRRKEEKNEEWERKLSNEKILFEKEIQKEKDIQQKEVDQMQSMKNELILVQNITRNSVEYEINDYFDQKFHHLLSNSGKSSVESNGPSKVIKKEEEDEEFPNHEYQQHNTKNSVGLIKKLDFRFLKLKGRGELLNNFEDVTTDDSVALSMREIMNDEEFWLRNVLALKQESERLEKKLSSLKSTTMENDDRDHEINNKMSDESGLLLENYRKKLGPNVTENSNLNCISYVMYKLCCLVKDIFHTRSSDPWKCNYHQRVTDADFLYA